jgi:hypothetical protein
MSICSKLNNNLFKGNYYFFPDLFPPQLSNGPFQGFVIPGKDPQSERRNLENESPPCQRVVEEMASTSPLSAMRYISFSTDGLYEKRYVVNRDF